MICDDQLNLFVNKINRKEKWKSFFNKFNFLKLEFY